MKRFSFFVVVFLLAGFIGFIGCDSGDDNTTPASPTIDPPTGLTAVAESYNEIVLNWSYASDEATFTLEKTDSSDGGWGVHAQVQAGVRTYTDVTGVNEGKTYQYRVKAVLNAETSDPSAAAGASTPPKPPTALMVDATTSTSISLGWTDVSSVEDGYEIQRKMPTDAEEDYETITTTASNINSYIDETVMANSTYNYRVRAVFNDLVSTWSDEITATTLTIPTGLTAEVLSDSEILLTWEDAGSEYRLERKTLDADEWVTAAELETGITTFTDTGLEEATAWNYRVYSVIMSGESDPSETVMAITLPIAPDNFVAQQDENTTTTINVSWSDNSSKEIKYQLQRRVGAEGNFQGYRILDADAVSFTDIGLISNQTYYYKIIVVASVTVDEGNIVEVSAACPDIAAATTSKLTPNPPTDLSGTAVDYATVALTWIDNSDNELGFKVLRGSSRYGVYTEIQSTAADIEQYTDTGLEEEVQYFYKVFAFNDSGNSDTSAIVSVVTPDGPPAAPQNLTITQVGYAHMEFTWDDVSDNEFGFVIEKSIGSADALAEYDRMPADTGYYYDRIIDPLTDYYYRVYAFGQAGNSGYSNVVSATSLIAPPRPPTNLIINGNPTLVRIPIAWDDNSDNEEGFIVERRTVPLWAYTVLDTLETNTVIYSDRNDLQGSTTYAYHVAAYNSSGGSGWSVELRVTTPPVPPQTPINLRAETTNLTEVDLIWEFATFNDIIDYYEIERRDSPDDDFNYLSEVEGLDNTIYHDTGLEPDEHTYWYHVRAVNVGGWSDWSDIAAVTTPALNPPENLTVEVAGITSLAVEWDYPYEVNYVIERSDTEMGEYAEVGTSDTTYFVDNNGLQPDSSVYWYRVKAVVGIHESDWSQATSGATPFIIQLDEGFEDLETDQPLGDPWTYVATAPAAILVTDTVSYSGDKSLHFVDPEGDAASAYVYTRFAEIPDGEITFQIKLTPGGYFRWYGLSDDGAGNLWIIFGTQLANDGSMLGIQGGGWNVVNGNWDNEDWFLVTLEWAGGAHSMSFNDQLLIDNWACMQNIPVNTILFQTLSGAGVMMENGWIDDLLVQYTYDEEEENNAGPLRYTAPANRIRFDPRVHNTVVRFR
ncbi:fibronectin type III domain-containing protein [bacterium]|nr:fibronectin type III domain-containing protein [bacterium]